MVTVFYRKLLASLPDKGEKIRLSVEHLKEIVACKQREQSCMLPKSFNETSNSSNTSLSFSLKETVKSEKSNELAESLQKPNASEYYDSATELSEKISKLAVKDTSASDQTSDIPSDQSKSEYRDIVHFPNNYERVLKRHVDDGPKHHFRPNRLVNFTFISIFTVRAGYLYVTDTL